MSARLAARPVRKAYKPRSKYGAVATELDGIRFHSAAESRRYAELKLLEKAGQICNLVLQPRFRLYAHKGIIGSLPVPIGEYVADFSYEEGRDWHTVVEDVKGGPIPPLSAWKIKHCEAQYSIKVRIIR